MSGQPIPSERYCFGPFEFDTAATELRKHGIRLRLRGQPLEVLSVLLERPGEITTRRQLQQRLWSETTFVDFDHGLNAAMNKLRQSLGDSAERPHYIETLPGEGYRFIGRVEVPQSLPARLKPPDPPFVEIIRHRSWPKWVGVGFGTALLALAFWIGRTSRALDAPGAGERGRILFQMSIPERLELSSSQTFSLSPDGRTLVYLARSAGESFRLWAQSLDQLEPDPLPGTEVTGGDPPVFWSPDSKFVAYYSAERLMKVDLQGNPPRVICRVPSVVLGGSWSPQGAIIFGTETQGIMRVSAAGGEPVQLTIRDTSKRERVHGWPTFLPDGHRYIYSRLSPVAANNAVFARSLDAKPSEPDLARLVDTTTAAVLVTPERGAKNSILLFLREGTLWSHTLDAAKLVVLDQPRRVTSDVGSARAFGFFAASQNARLVYRNTPPDMVQLAWWDRRGHQLKTVGEPAPLDSVFSPVLSPDGTRFVTSQYEKGDFDIWVYDLNRGGGQRITFDPSLDIAPIWSRDGNRILFSSGRSGRFDLFQIDPASGTSESLLYSSGQNKYPTSISPDGRFLLFSSLTERNNFDVWALPLEGAGKRVASPLIATDADERSAAISPDGSRVAFVSNESGRPEVYVQPFKPGGVTGVPKTLVSDRGGENPRWRADGRELYYWLPDRTLASVSFADADTLRPGVAQRLFRLPGARWDSAGDGTRFLVGEPKERAVAPFTVVLNWPL